MTGSPRRAAESRPRAWRWFCAIAGVLTLAAGALNVAGPLGGLTSGCTVRISPIGIRLGDGSNCAYNMDLVSVAIPVALGLVLLVGAWRYLRPDGPSRVATWLAAAAAVAVAAYPVYIVWWLLDFYRLSVGPVEMVMLALALGVLGLALLAGWRTAQGTATRQ